MESDCPLLDTQGQSSSLPISALSYEHICPTISLAAGSNELVTIVSSSSLHLSNHNDGSREGTSTESTVASGFSSASNANISSPPNPLLASSDEANGLTGPTFHGLQFSEQLPLPSPLKASDDACTLAHLNESGTNNSNTATSVILPSAASVEICDVDLPTITTISESQSSSPASCTANSVHSSTSTSSTSSLPSTELSVLTTVSSLSDTPTPTNAGLSEPQVMVSQLDITNSLVSSCADKDDVSLSTTESLESCTNTPEFPVSSSSSSIGNVLAPSISPSDELRQSFCDMVPSCVLTDGPSSMAPFVSNAVGPPLLPLTSPLYPTFNQPVGDISSTLPNLPPTVTAAPLPPFFRFTLVPMSPNGDFPAVQLNLPDLPVVILQVLPLSGARVGEQYVINVPTPLILNGINSALANGGTVNGGPIMLSIAPSGTVPPPDSVNHGVKPAPTLVSHSSPQDSGTVTSALLPSLNYTPSGTSSTLPGVLVSLPVGVVSNGLAPVRLPVSSIPQLTSNQSITLNNGGKRMRAIAPKPCLNLALRSFTTVLSGSTSRSAPSCKTVPKKSSIVVTTGNSPIGDISSSTSTATVECSVAVNSQLLTAKGKKVSILPVYSPARSNRGRRKVNVFPSSTLSTSNSAPVMLTTSHCCPISSSGVTPSSDAVLAPCSSVPALMHPTFTTQPILIPNSTSPGISGPVAPSGHLPPAFLFGSPFAPGSTPGSTHPYIIPQPFSFHGSCPSFPASIYNPSSCSTTLSPATSPLSIAGSLPPASSAPVYPSGPPTAMATVDPATGMVTHYSAPCVPLALPTGSSTDQTTFGLPIVYSQSNQNALGFIVPTVSQANSLVFPVPGHSILPAQLPTLPTTLSSTANSIGLDNRCGLDQSISTSFIPRCPLSSELLVPSSASPAPVQMSQALGTLMPAPGSYFSPGDNSASFVPVFSTTSGRSTESITISSSYDVLTLDDDPKDDLISIAWRLTQMDDEPTLSGDLSQQQTTIHSNGISVGSGSYGALFESCAQDKLEYAYSEACGDLYALHSDGTSECESAEVVLLDSKHPSSLVSIPHSSGADNFSISSESTGNADIDALLAAAAMVGAASGVGDAQSAVTVPVPTSFSTINSQDTTACQSIPRSPSSPLVTASAPTTVVVPAPLSLDAIETQSASSPASVETVLNNENHTDRLPVVVEKEPTELLPSDLFADFDNPPRDDAFTRESAEVMPGFDESDEPTSLAAALGCSDEDAADLKSILYPEAHNLGETGAVSDSFLNSLVDAPELDLGGADENGEHLFDADFDVCAPVSLGQPDAVDQSNLHASSLGDLNADRFDLDYSELTKDSSQAEITLVTDMPIPSSHQVRSLLRNTVPTVLSYRFASSRLVLTSDETKLFDGLFVPSKSSKRNSRTCRLSAQTTDDFLGVDFTDAVGEYTTAEQFDEALMLLGPPPSSPVHYPISSQAVTSTLANSVPNLENTEVPVMLPETNEQTAIHSPLVVVARAEERSPLLPDSSPGNVSKAAEAAHIDSTCGFDEPDDRGTNTLSDSPIGVSPRPVSPIRSSDDTLASLPLTSERQPADSFEASSPSVKPNESAHESAPAMEPCLSSASTNELVSADPTCSVDTSLQLPHTYPTENLEKSQLLNETASGTLPDYEDAEETLAMEIDQVEPDSTQSSFMASEVVGASSPKNAVVTPDDCGNCNTLLAVSTPFRRRTRSASLALTAQTVTKTSIPNALLSMTRGYTRRRLASAPTTNVTTPTRSRRCSPAALSTPFLRTRASLGEQVTSPVSQPCTMQCVDPRSPQDSSTSSQGIAGSSNSSIPPSSSWLPRPTDNGVSSHSITTSSLLGVLASSSALLEAAVEGMVSDSDISPVKSSIEGLEKLDRMLRSCERQSKQTLESSDSKSSRLTSSTDNATSSNSQGSICVVAKTSAEEGERESATKCIVSSIAVKQMHTNGNVPSLPVKQTSVDTRKRRPRRLKRRTGRKPGNFQPSSNPDPHSPKSTQDCSLSEAALSVSTFTTPPVYSTSHCTLLLPSYERPLSFGLSSDVASDLSSGPNPLMEANFEQHVPRLNLVFQGPLFPEAVPSSPEVDESKHALQSITTPPNIYELCSVSCSTANSPLKSLPHNKASSLRSARRKHHRRRSKRTSRTRHETPTSLSAYAETHSHLPSSSSIPNAVLIAPIHLTVPADNASFSRFIDSTDLPSFTTIQCSGTTQTAPVKISTSVWNHLPGSGTLLFKEFCKSDVEFKQSSPAHSSIVPESMDHSPSLRSCSTQLRSTDEFAGTDSPHLNSQSSIHTSILSVDSSSSVSCAAHSGFSAPAFPNLPVCSQSVSLSAPASNVSDSPIVRSASSTPVACSSGLTIVTTAVVSQLQFTGVIPTSSSFPLTNTWPSVSFGTTSSIKQHTWNPSASVLSVPSSQFAGMPFGSFAGAAAFRATSFSALAAKANTSASATNPNDISFWINRPSFSDLAKAAAFDPTPVLRGHFKRISPLPEVTACVCSPLSICKDGVSSHATYAMRLFQAHSLRDTSALNTSSTSHSEVKCPTADLQPLEPPVSEMAKSPIYSLSTVIVESRVSELSVARRRRARSKPLRRRRGYREVRSCAAAVSRSADTRGGNTPTPAITDLDLEKTSPLNKPVSELDIPSSVSGSEILSEHSAIHHEHGTLTPQDSMPLDIPHTEPSTPPLDISQEKLDAPEFTKCDAGQSSGQSPSGCPPWESANSNSVSSSVLPSALATRNFGVSASSPIQPDHVRHCSPPSSFASIATSPPPSQMSSSTTAVASDSLSALVCNGGDLVPILVSPVVPDKLPASPRVTGSDRPQGSAEELISTAQHPPIRLRLNLKSAMKKNYAHKANKKHPVSFTVVTECTDRTVPVIASSTPTTLNIRLKSHAVSDSTAVSSTLTHRKRKTRSKKSSTKRPRSGDSQCTNLCAGGVSGRGATKDNSVPSALTINFTSSGTPNQVATPNHSVAGTRPSSSVFQSMLTPVFSKKIFSTAKQDRRSSYAQVSRPWRSGISVSPRKRGFSKIYSKVAAKSVSNGVVSTVTLKRPRLDSTVSNSTTRPVPASTGRRGLPSTRFRPNQRGRGRTGRLISAATSCVVPVTKTPEIPRRCDTEDSRGIRLVIRLGRSSLRHTSFHDDSSITSAVTMPVNTQIINGASSSSSESPIASDSDADLRAVDDECFAGSQVNDITDPRKSSGLSNFEFCIAPEAQTYMDQNQVQISRCLNDAVSLRLESGGVSDIFPPSPGHGGSNHGEALLRNTLVRSSEFGTTLGAPFSLDCPQVSYATHHSRTESSYDSGTLHNLISNDSDRNSTLVARQHFESIYKGSESYASMITSSAAEARSLSNDHIYPCDSRSCDTGVFPVCSLRKVAPVHSHPGVPTFGQAIPIKATGFLDT